MKWADRQISDAEQELSERETPLRLRDSRAAPDDGYDDYLTMAEEMTRSVKVAVSKEKLRLLREYKGIEESIEKEMEDGENDW